MSSFNCEHCQAPCTDTEVGYVTGCEHYPVNREHLNRWYRVTLNRLNAAVSFMATVSAQNKDGLAEPFLRWQADILGTMELVKPNVDSGKPKAKSKSAKRRASTGTDPSSNQAD